MIENQLFCHSFRLKKYAITILRNKEFYKFDYNDNDLY